MKTRAVPATGWLTYRYSKETADKLRTYDEADSECKRQQIAQSSSSSSDNATGRGATTPKRARYSTGFYFDGNLPTPATNQSKLCSLPSMSDLPSAGTGTPAAGNSADPGQQAGSSGSGTKKKAAPTPKQVKRHVNMPNLESVCGSVGGAIRTVSIDRTPKMRRRMRQLSLIREFYFNRRDQEFIRVRKM